MPSAPARHPRSPHFRRASSHYDPPPCRKPLDAAPVSTDSRAHRATRAAPNLVLNTGQGAALSSGWRPSGGVPGRHKAERPNPEVLDRTGPRGHQKDSINRGDSWTPEGGDHRRPRGPDSQTIRREVMVRPGVTPSSASTARPGRSEADLDSAGSAAPSNDEAAHDPPPDAGWLHGVAPGLVRGTDLRSGLAVVLPARPLRPGRYSRSRRVWASTTRTSTERPLSSGAHRLADVAGRRVI
jgi:hypothetical protein